MPQPDPVAFTLFGLEIRWYGVLIAIAVLTAFFLSIKRAPRRDIDPDDYFTVMIISVLAGFAGARLYYVIFSWEDYAGDLMEIFNTRGGGLAIHGGLIAAFLTAYFLCRHKKISFSDALDTAVPNIALAQAIGRWGNYFNSEAHGGPTDFPISVMIDGQSYHATFLYESLWCLFLFFLLSHIDKQRRFPFQTSLLYGILYSAERFCVEGLRTDSLMLGPLKQAQVLSLALIAVCVVLYIYLSRKKDLPGKS